MDFARPKCSRRGSIEIIRVAEKAPSSANDKEKNMERQMLAEVLSDSHIACDWDSIEWSLKELKLLNATNTPVYCVDLGLQEECERMAVFSPDYVPYRRIIFANSSAEAYFGKVRPQEEADSLFAKLPEDKRHEMFVRLKSFQQMVGRTVSVLPPSNFASESFSNVPMGDEPKSFYAQKVWVRLGEGQPAKPCCLVSMDAGFEPTVTRGASLFHMCPNHLMQFDRQGQLVQANRAALKQYKADRGTESFSFSDIMAYGTYEGGLPAMKQIESDLMHAIFVRGAESASHLQTRKSPVEGSKTEYILLDMWPFIDPVTKETTMFLMLSNATDQKESEILQDEYQDALEEQYKELELENSALEAANTLVNEKHDKLASQHFNLSAKLLALMNQNKMPEPSIDAETPVDKVVKLLDDMILGEGEPTIQELLDLKKLMTSSKDLRAPIQLESQLRANDSFDIEVTQSMMQMLEGKTVGQIERRSFEKFRRASTSLKVAAFKPDISSLLGEQAREEDWSLEWVPKAPVPELDRLLQGSHTSWQYNVLDLEKASEQPLALLAFHLMQMSGVIHQFNLNTEKLCRFLHRVEMGYPDNPYHNRVHAAEVLHRTFMLMHHGGMLKLGVVDGLGVLSGLLAAAVHDFEHRGLNNDFLIKSRDPLALTYNERSPMENHHLAATFRLLMLPQYDFMEAMSGREQAVVRTTVISQVLATDMKQHFSSISRFQTSFRSRHTSESSKGASRKTSLNISNVGGAPVKVDWHLLTDDDKDLAKQMALKMADIGHLSAPRELHKMWAARLEDELFLQGDAEKAAGLPISPLMDRTSPKGGVTRSQVGFFSIVGVPLMHAFVGIFQDAKPLLDGALANLKLWEEAVSHNSSRRTTDQIGTISRQNSRPVDHAV